MNGLMAAVRKEVLEHLRTHRFLIVGAVLVGFGLISPLLAKFTPDLIAMLPGANQLAGQFPEPTVHDAVAQYIKNTGQLGLVMAILVTMGAVTREKDQGTAAVMLVKPLTRWEFLLAKFLVLLAVFAVGLTLAGLAGYFYTRLLFEPMPVGAWMAVNGLILAYVSVYVGITLFFSTVGRSQAAAGGMSVAALVVMALLGSLPGLGDYLPGQLMGWASMQLLQPDHSAWPALLTSLGIMGAALIAAWLALRRQEL